MEEQQNDADFTEQKNHVGDIKMFDRVNQPKNTWTDDDARDDFAEYGRDLDAFGKFGGQACDKNDDEQVAENEREVVTLG